VAEARGEHLGLAAIFRHLHEAASGRQVGVAGLEEVEVAVGVGLQTGVVGVLAGAGVPVVAQALVEVGLAVAVAVVQSGELPALQYDDLAVHHLQPERVVQPRGEPLPVALGPGLVHPHEPDVAVAGADGDAAVGQEVHPGAEEERLERVVVGHGQRVDGERPGLVAADELGDDGLAPACGAGLEVLRECRRRRDIGKAYKYSVVRRGRLRPPGDLESANGFARSHLVPDSVVGNNLLNFTLGTCKTDCPLFHLDKRNRPV
jgi:hypothetical protein